jgi:hypothetical protein
MVVRVHHPEPVYNGEYVMKILILPVLALGLSGCNATVYTQRPNVSVGYPVYAQHVPVSRPYYTHQHYRYVPRQCYTTWDRTPYGVRERRICR